MNWIATKTTEENSSTDVKTRVCSSCGYFSISTNTKFPRKMTTNMFLHMCPTFLKLSSLLQAPGQRFSKWLCLLAMWQLRMEHTYCVYLLCVLYEWNMRTCADKSIVLVHIIIWRFCVNIWWNSSYDILLKKEKTMKFY